MAQPYRYGKEIRTFEMRQLFYGQKEGIDTLAEAGFRNLEI